MFPRLRRRVNWIFLILALFLLAIFIIGSFR